VIVDPDYRRYRIEVNAVAEGGHWNAEVRIRRTLSQDTPLVERVSCFKLSADHAERAGMLWAKRWVDADMTS